MQKEKANLQNELTDFEERIEAMTSHLKNVRQEFSFTQVNRYLQQIRVTRQTCNLSTFLPLASLCFARFVRDLPGLYSRTSTGNRS